MASFLPPNPRWRIMVTDKDTETQYWVARSFAPGLTITRDPRDALIFIHRHSIDRLMEDGEFDSWDHLELYAEPMSPFSEEELS